MRTHRFVACALSALIATNASAYSGEGLLSGLKKSLRDEDRSDAAEAAMAEGFVLGVFAVLGTAKTVCPPPNVTATQLDAVVRKFLEERPKEWSESAAPLAMAALANAFPCGDRSKSHTKD